MLHAVLAFGVYMLPWRIAFLLIVLLTIASGIGAAVIMTALLGWTLFFIWCWRYA